MTLLKRLLRRIARGATPASAHSDILAGIKFPCC
jgi:hypothetical protein